MHHSKLFNTIAPIYAKFFDLQVRYYENTLQKISNEMDLTQYKTILDLGCGTGALCYVLFKNGHQVTGVDIAAGMIKKAKERLKNTNIVLMQVHPDEDLPFPDHSFDLVISAYVAHGLNSHARIALYKEAYRVAKHKVVFHDYNGKRRLLTTIVEWLEKGDYFNFIKLAELEMLEHFGNVKVVDVHPQAAWYISEKSQKH